METKKFETTVGGRPLSAEFNPLAEQANGSVIIRYGDTVVLAAAVMSKKSDAYLGYFPLTVDYEEKFYAAGRIPGSRFLRREARPSEDAILVSRVIDRTIRPLFDQRIRHSVQVSAIPLSYDETANPDMPAVIAVSLAFLTSDIPWNGPIGTVRIASIDGALVVNPSKTETERAAFELVVSGNDGKFNMIEMRGKEVSEDDIARALETAAPEINKLVVWQNDIAKAIGKEKRVIEIPECGEDVQKAFRESIVPKVEEMFASPKTKKEFYATVENIERTWTDRIASDFPDTPVDRAKELLEEGVDEVMHRYIFEKGVRADGRGLTDVRPLAAETSFLPRVHGSGVFFRGDTHILSVVTLGSPGEFLMQDTMTRIDGEKRFMHQYNFPKFSVGEAGRAGAPGRREIGHGALAEKALEAVIPVKDAFPYTIRIVSETLSSNGSSSMGSVSASSVALMDAGVPITAPVAGIAMGLVVNDKGDYKILTDIQGPEDHYGDMDFKVAGTAKGVTAMQMDIKVDGVTLPMLKEGLKDAKTARLKVLEAIQKAISAPRPEVAPHAPKILRIRIDPLKIGDLIGPGGKMINAITKETETTIDVEQDGTVYVTGKTKAAVEAAMMRVKQATKQFEVGETFEGKVSRIFPFGAMVEIAPGQEGLVHISELAPFRVEHVADVVALGDAVPVKVVGIDELGRVNLSIKAMTTLEPKRNGGNGAGSSHDAHDNRGTMNGHDPRNSRPREQR